MSSNHTLNYGINFSVNPPKFFGGLDKSIDQITENTKKMSASFGGCWRQLLSVNQALEGVRNLQSVLDATLQPGIALNSSLADLSAITGLAGKSLEAISDAARASAKAFGTDAAQNVESYKLILSQLSPDIAKNSSALKAMGDHVNILSKTMGGNTVAATEVLTTAMNQYGVSLDDPMQASKTMAEMMNVMAAAAKEGSAELPQIKAALENVGMVAKTTGVSFSETNAAIQVLDKAGKKGAEGGIALRNVLSTLSEGRFLPKQTQAELVATGISISQLANQSIPLTARLSTLKPVMNDTALITKLFGKENSAAAIALINGSEALDEYNSKIQGTNTAVEQAKIVMGSFSEEIKRKTAFWDNLKIGFFNTIQGVVPKMHTLFTGLSGLGQMYSGIKVLTTFIGTKFIQSIWSATKSLALKTLGIQADTVAIGINTVKTWAASLATKAWTGVQRIFNTVMAANPIGATIRAVLLLTAGIVAATAAYSAYTKNQDVAKTVSTELNSQMLVEQRGLNDLFEQLKRTNPASERRKQLIEEMNARYPGLLDYQKLETANEQDIEKARRQANDELERTIILSAQKSQKEAVIKKTAEKEKELADELFDKGANMTQISGLLSTIDKQADELVKSGKYESGWFSGASDSLISDVYLQLARDPKLQVLTSHDPQKIMDLIDAKLTGYNQMAAYQKFVDTKMGKTASEQTKKDSKTDEKELDKNKSKNPLANLGATAAASVKTSDTSTLSSFGSHKGSSGNTSGGNRNITINKLVETLIVKVERLPESKERIKDAVSEALLLAVNDYNLAT